MTKQQMLVILTLVVTLGTSAFGQSTDENSSTPITSNVLTGTLRGSGTYVYSLKARRGTSVSVRADLTVAGDGSQGFSLDFRGKAGVTGGQTNCCEGETYMSLSADPTLRTSFRVITDAKFLMFLNFSASERPLPYRITFEGLNFDAEPVGDDHTLIVPGRNLALERAALTQRDKVEEMLPPWAKHKLEIVFKGFLKRLLRDSKPVNAAQIVKEELARQFTDLSQEQAHILTFYVVTGVIKKVPLTHREWQAERKRLNDKKDSISEMGERDMLMLQQMMEKKNQLESMISNMMKAGFEGGQAAIQALMAS